MKKKSAEERFWDHVVIEEPDKCWEPTIGRTRGGYCQMRSDDGVKIYMHRYAYELMRGPIPDGMYIDHKCHNTACVNPAHLRLCSTFENARNTRVTKRSRSGVKGVSRRESGKWRSRIRVNYGLIDLGSYDSIEEAKDAYSKAAIKYFGDFAYIEPD